MGREAKTIQGAATKLFIVRVQVMNGYRGEYLEMVEWRGLRFDLLMKWMWYFEYRQALLKVKYPRLRVELSQLDYKPETRSDLEVYRSQIKKLLTARKRKVTEIENNLKRARQSWDELFPIEENPYWKKAIEKLERVKAERDKYEETIREIDQKL